MSGGAVVSWLVRSPADRVVRVRDLAGDILLRSWPKHLLDTLIVPLSTQVCKCVPENLMLGVTQRWTSIPSRGEYKYTPRRFMLLNPDIRFGLMSHLARMRTLPKNVRTCLAK